MLRTRHCARLVWWGLKVSCVLFAALRITGKSRQAGLTEFPTSMNKKYRLVGEERRNTKGKSSTQYEDQMLSPPHLSRRLYSHH